MRQLTGPFRASEAMAAGLLTRRDLQRDHIPVYPGIWVPRTAELTHPLLTTAAWLWSNRHGIPAGLSASALRGAKWVGVEQPVELIHVNRRAPAGIIVHSNELARGEAKSVAGMQVTTAARTAFDIGRRLATIPGVQRIDALMNATQLKVAAVEEVIAAHPGARGLCQLRETLALVDGGAESLYESLTRVLLIQRGFPPLETQIEVLDAYGDIFARLDMGWRQYGVGVDFEGAQHWTNSRQWNWDVERYSKIPELGWIDIRVTSGMLFNLRSRHKFFNRVGAALISRGCPKTW
jgi:hypothetical protein